MILQNGFNNNPVPDVRVRMEVSVRLVKWSSGLIGVYDMFNEIDKFIFKTTENGKNIPGNFENSQVSENCKYIINIMTDGAVSLGAE